MSLITREFVTRYELPYCMRTAHAASGSACMYGSGVIWSTNSQDRPELNQKEDEFYLCWLVCWFVGLLVVMPELGYAHPVQVTRLRGCMDSCHIFLRREYHTNPKTVELFLAHVSKFWKTRSRMNPCNHFALRGGRPLWSMLNVARYRSGALTVSFSAINKG